MNRARRLPSVGSGYPPRLRALVLAIIVAGCPLVAAASLQVVHRHPGATVIGAVALFACALAAELKPVPVDVEGERLVSLAFVFVVASQMILGWHWSVLIGAVGIAIALAHARATRLRTLFNASVYALAAAAASLPGLLVAPDQMGAGRYAVETVLVCVSGLLFVAVNIGLVSSAMALSSGEKLATVLRDHMRHSGLAFVVMSLLAAQAVIFWNVSPLLLMLLAAPLFTLNLYQRAAVRRRVAELAATIDSLTGLKNHRAYEDELPSALRDAAIEERSLALCLIDVDRFKQVNDRYGHVVGDEVLAALSRVIDDLATGKGYRLGGDEFAVVLEDADEGAAIALASTLHHRVAGVDFAGVAEAVTVSTGIACYPDHAVELLELKKCADRALYHSKRNGKNRSSVYRESTAGESPPPPVGDGVPRNARLRTAERLVSVVDARDAYVGSHSVAVADLAVAIGRRLGLGEEELVLLRLAGLLHDLGKVGLPDSILSKPGPLTHDEMETMRRHPQLGFDLLHGLDLAPADEWVLYHHEHWDGSGYPLGLREAEIPFGSRIILVADAFEAMTTHRSYRRAVSVESAMAELRDGAGRQFDPLVVAALESHLADAAPVRAAIGASA
ncbi:MAG: diguanylate cyclase [Actinomycetota bacterium]|nr:diguanylate cyclase [Actinomycetota bacterium]